MKRKRTSKMLVNGTAYLFSVMLLLSMVVAPVIASVSEGSVTSTHIKDGTILNRDIRPNKISSSRIKDYTILKEDIHSSAVNTYKILDGTIQNRDISPKAAISDSKINFNTTKTGHVSVHASAFTPETQNHTYSQNSGYSLYSTGVGTQKFFAPVQLPDNAKVTKVTFETHDNDPSLGIAWMLLRRSVSGSAADLSPLASHATSAGSVASGWQNLVDTSIATGKDVVDNLNYSYFLQVKFNGNSKNVLAGRVLIEYTHTSPGS